MWVELEWMVVELKERQPWERALEIDFQLICLPPDMVSLCLQLDPFARIQEEFGWVEIFPTVEEVATVVASDFCVVTRLSSGISSSRGAFLFCFFFCGLFGCYGGGGGVFFLDFSGVGFITPVVVS
ncbi:hypothetical protein HanRHA438_Chr05g0207361 [Helianthus annuus]|nr:hypothetical protein HanRHA438_Chr05g0207361 [Helianthus annuus]